MKHMFPNSQNEGCTPTTMQSKMSDRPICYHLDALDTMVALPCTPVVSEPSALLELHFAKLIHGRHEAFLSFAAKDTIGQYQTTAQLQNDRLFPW